MDIFGGVLSHHTPLLPCPSFRFLVLPSYLGWRRGTGLVVIGQALPHFSDSCRGHSLYNMGHSSPSPSALKAVTGIPGIQKSHIPHTGSLHIPSCSRPSDPRGHGLFLICGILVPATYLEPASLPEKSVACMSEEREKKILPALLLREMKDV